MSRDLPLSHHFSAMLVLPEVYDGVCRLRAAEPPWYTPIEFGFTAERGRAYNFAWHTPLRKRSMPCLCEKVCWTVLPVLNVINHSRPYLCISSRSQGRIQDFHWGGAADHGAPFLLVKGAPYILRGRRYGRKGAFFARRAPRLAGGAAYLLRRAPSRAKKRLLVSEGRLCWRKGAHTTFHGAKFDPGLK